MPQLVKYSVKYYIHTGVYKIGFTYQDMKLPIGIENVGPMGKVTVSIVHDILGLHIVCDLSSQMHQYLLLNTSMKRSFPTCK